MTTSYTRTRTLTVLAAAGAVALTGCASTKNTAVNTPAASSLASAAATTDSGGSSPEVAAAQAIVDKSLMAPTAIGQTVPLKMAVKKGQTYVFLECELPVCKIIGDGAVAAAQAIGWKTKVLPWKTSDPATLVSAMKQALDYKPVAVTPTGFPQAVWGSPAIEAMYKKAGALIVPAAVGSLTTSATVPGGASTGSDYKASGVVLGNWFIADSKAMGHALLMDVPAYEVLKDLGDSTKATVAAGCKACKITPLDATLPQLASNGVVPAVISALQKDKSITYVLATEGPFLSGLPSALKAAGLNNIKIGGGAPSITDLQNLATGTEAAWTGEAPSQIGWAVVDVAARAQLGMTVPDADGGRPQQLLVKSNVGTPTESLDAPKDYQAQYKKLWLVG